MILYYNPQLKEEWTSGNLKRLWKERFSELFTDEDYKLVNNQNSYHFGEWFAAMIFFLQGYRVFIEKYTCGGKRPEQIKEMKEVMGKSNFEKVMAKTSGAPDLFVFDEKTKKFFFVEVKVDRDSVKAKQKYFLESFEKENICPLYVLHLKSQIL